MYHYLECGLRNVWLTNGYEEHKTPYGAGVSIHNVDELHREIGRGLVSKVGKLTGAEMRFLRQDMGLSQSKLALMLGNDAQTIAIWEKSGRQPKMADRFVRALYREKQDGNAHIIQMIERMVDSDLVEANARLTLQQNDGGWKLAA